MAVYIKIAEKSPNFSEHPAPYLEGCKHHGILLPAAVADNKNPVISSNNHHENAKIKKFSPISVVKGTKFFSRYDTKRIEYKWVRMGLRQF